MNKQALQNYVQEVAGENQELATKMLEIFGTNEEAANRFLSGFEGRAESTRRFQEAAKTQKNAETLLTDYQNQLGVAEERMKKVMKDLADESISAATAKAQLKVIKEKYQLSDDDIPNEQDIRKTQDTGKVGRGVVDIDLDERLKDFEKKLMDNITSRLIPELSGLATLPIAWNQINSEHQELTGKRLTKKEQEEILAEAREKNKSLGEIWESKYSIGSVRETKSDEVKKAKWEDEWNKKEQAKRTEEALSGGHKRDGVEMVPDSQRSPLLRKKFAPQDESEEGGKQREGKQQEQPREKRSGAERAADNFMRRRSQGIPWGQQEKVAS